MSKTNRYRLAIASLFYLSCCLGPTLPGAAIAAVMLSLIVIAPGDILPIVSRS